MSCIATELASLLGTVRRPGDYFVSGTAEIFAPLLEVTGVGPVALPLLPIQAKELIAVAERAPFGRGEETVIDTQVRRTWQIGADRVRIGGRHWAQTLETILSRVAERLGVTDPIEAELYKLLVYDQGSFFVSHRDTEKAPGMFGTLVLVLPSISTGGELVVRHKGREVRLELRSADPSEVAFAAFYADCVHEVLPISTGCRLTLVYNLLRRGKGPKPEPPSYEEEQTKVTDALLAWAGGRRSPDDDVPEKLIYLLEHAYTPAELDFGALKGADAAVAGVLVAAAGRSGCDLHLALLSVDESGAAEYVGGGGSYRGRWSEPDLEAGEVFERYETLSEWRRPDGSPAALAGLPVEENELSPPKALDELEPDEEEFHEATGNEGATFERTYRRAAFVLWPRERVLAVLNQAGLTATIPYLADFAARWEASGEDRRSSLWVQAHELSGHMLSSWPKHRWPRGGGDGAPSTATSMLTSLIRLGDTARIDAFLADLAPAGLYDKVDNPAIVAALGLLSRDRAAALLQRIIAGTAATSLVACGDLLTRAVVTLGDDPNALMGPASALVEALPGDPTRAAPSEPWQRAPTVVPAFIVDLFTALARVDQSLARQAVDHVLSWPEIYGFDRVLVPAVCDLFGSRATNDVRVVQRLRAACIEHLRVRAAEPLHAPTDWSRASAVGCQCRYCSELSKFLANGERKIWTFKAAEIDRKHVEATVRQAHCDLDLVTDRRGRPYGLICTKNQASYERRMKQRAKDLSDLQRLQA